MSSLFEYAKQIVEKAGKAFSSGEIFAKVLSRNDDAGRHGVLIPTDAYSYFPPLPIPDPEVNSTAEFTAFDATSSCWVTLAYKYYERYPERRVTRLNSSLNDLGSSPRLLIFIRVKHTDGSTGFYFDCANSSNNGRFQELFQLIFGCELQSSPGNFVIRPLDSNAFSSDPALTELLGKFDEVRAQGWIDSLRTGDTGIGYTFETLLGIKENNDQVADYKGIEIKCKAMKEGAVGNSTKINLFQAGPTWSIKASGRDRIRLLGKIGENGLYACFSQVTTATNNLGLLLDIVDETKRIDLKKDAEALGYWSFNQLEKRLSEKHSRAVFVKAEKRQAQGKTQFGFKELVYCERPSIDRFIELANHRSIVFEFTMSEKPNGSIRNHGYPWRLIHADYLDQLFAFQVKLR